jgi:23S rRNA (cytidine1920-2'-O)/16S rRNA (cytidine1409-2'-O)-methyltransferase
MPDYVSRAGQKLEHAIATFSIDVTGKTCADLGCSTGGFTDCMLQHGAQKVFAVDTGYGVLDWKLRNDPRVIVLERTNAMHVKLLEPVQLISIDVAWTRQKNILPSARRLLDANGIVISLIKPHYEASQTLAEVKTDIEAAGFQLLQTVESPIKGAKGNTEFLGLLELI